MYVWDDSHCRLFFQGWNKRRLAGGFYDELRPAESTAHYLQCGAWADSAFCAYYFLFFVRKSCGIAGAGFLLPQNLFDFGGFDEPKNRDTDPNLLLRFFKNFGRNVRATGGWFFMGIVLSALFQRYVPAEVMTDLFGGNQAFGVLMAATIGVPLYACGGGTIPLLQGWLFDGMSMGSAAAFMITGPATKITNLGAVKIVPGARRFALYFLYVMLFSFLAGLLVNAVV